ncbi:MAG: hypothetical protein J1E07_01085 [Treponema sp.]|nr:hypothetical protein [Treponema sp.]
MKRFSTVLAAVAALVLACAFVSCKNDVGGSVVSEWGYVGMYYSTQPDENDYEIYEEVGIIFTFYSGGKVDVKWGEDLYTGTYEGDTTEPGDEITMTVAKGDDERYCEGTVTDGGNLIRFSEWWEPPAAKGTQSAYQKYYIGKI